MKYRILPRIGYYFLGLFLMTGIFAPASAFEDAKGYTADDCMACHCAKNGDSTLQIPVESYEASVHGRSVTCLECHTGITNEDHMSGEGVDRVNCSQCHEMETGKTGLFSIFSSSRIASHKKADFRNTYTIDNCLGCHQGTGAHGETDPVNDQDCYKCHDPNTKAAMWGSMHPETKDRSFDILLIIFAFIILIKGLSLRWSLWKKKKDPTISGDLGRVTDYLVKHTEIRKRPAVGAAHMALFWGFFLPVIIIITAQFGFFSIPKAPALLLSLLQDMTGIAMLAGILYLFFRRIQSGETDGPKRTIIPMFILLIILLSGFLAEASRLGITGNKAAWASPIGWIMSFGIPFSPLFTQFMIRLHFFSVLLFIALVPFTFMRHLAAAPLNVFYKKQGPRAALRKITLETGEIGAKTAEDFSWKQLLETESCVSCGRCEENCPAAICGKPLSPRKIIMKILEQAQTAAVCQSRFSKPSAQSLLEDIISNDEIWACTTCMACVEHCPVFVEAMDKIVDMRRYQVMGKGNLPAEARPMIRDLELYGDVQGKGAAHRADWAMHRDVPQIGSVEDAEVLFWVGCSGAFHPRNKETAQAFVKILKAAGISFGILAQEELCCGDPARRLGDEALYQTLAKQNIDMFLRHQIKKIVTLCPHCLNTLKNEYPDLGCTIPVVHATQFVMDLISEQRITLKYPVAQTMAVHDACYLGRYNEVYQPPRDICKAVPGTRLKELLRNRENGFCCGGGGGRMWLHENTGQNINVIRAEEVANADIDIIATSCPFCLVMLDDGVKSLEREKIPEVADIIDIVARAIK